MFEIFAYLTLFIVSVIFIFQIFIWLGSYLLLIDEKFVNKIENLNEGITNKLIDNTQDNEELKRLNTFLRYDFIISLFIAILIFIFPKLIFNFTSSELSKINTENKYLGEFLSILIALSSILSLKTIKKKKFLDKKLVLITKILCAIIILLVLLLNIYFLKRINNYSIITILALSIWISSNILGLCSNKQIN